MEKNIYLFSGLLGLVVFILTLFRYKKNYNNNIYFLVLIFVSSFRFILHGVTDIFTNLLPLQNKLDVLVILIAWPLIYLYFSKLVFTHRNIKKSDLLHFVAPLLFFIFINFKIYFSSKLFEVVIVVGQIFFIINTFWYVIVSYKLLKNNVWSVKNMFLINQKITLLKQRTLMMYLLFITLTLRFILINVLNYFGISFFNGNDFLWFTALICMGLFLKMLYSPELIYGYHVFQKKLKDYKEYTIVYKNIWITTNPEVSNIQDAILKEKIVVNIENYIVAIENLAVNSNAFFTEKYNTTNLANELNIPKSHVLYLFKYHSKIKFSELKKIIRIQKTVLLMDNGFLKKNTMESLASEVGFTSYSSFFKSFLSITGVSPQEYHKK